MIPAFSFPNTVDPFCHLRLFDHSDLGPIQFYTALMNIPTSVDTLGHTVRSFAASGPLLRRD